MIEAQVKKRRHELRLIETKFVSKNLSSRHLVVQPEIKLEMRKD